MKGKGQVIKAAVVQAAAVLFEREASLEKACRLIGECGEVSRSRKVLSQEPVQILDSRALPRASRVTEVDGKAGF